MRRTHSAPGAFRALVATVVLLAAAMPLAAQQAVDEDYSAKIREYTTEPFFLTPLIETLPASDVVPSPAEHFGDIVGAPNILHYPEEIYAYMRAVAAASPRVEVFSIGQTEEGREMIVVVVADEQTIAGLDENKAMLAALSDPRKTSEEEAQRLIGTAKPIYWATGAMHSPETGSPEMLMELVYRLAVDESPFIREIRDNLVFMATPVIEVDGRAKVVDLAMGPRKQPGLNVPTRPLYWGKYVAHDNNRDGLGLSLMITQNVVRTFNEYHPTVMHDLHESASYLYTSTGRGPYNAWVDPIVINEWGRLAYKEVQDMAAFGVPGVYTHDFYDGWAPNYMFWIANMRNSIGRFYETQGSGDASYRVLQTNVDRQWHRPNTPLRQVVWGIRNNVNLQQSALLIALNEVATHRSEYLSNYWLKGQRSVAKARTEGPAAYVFPASDPRKGQQAALLSLLQQHGIEVHRASRSFTAGGEEYGAGSYVVRMDQPYSRAADMLLDKQYYNPDDPSPYDDTGWTLGPLFNVVTARVEDTAVLDAPMSLVTESVRAPGGLLERRSNAAAYVVDYNADNSLASFRYAHPDLRILAAERPFEAGGRSYSAGSFLIPSAGATADLADQLDAAGREYGFQVAALGSLPDVPTHPVSAPRVAVVHTWQTTQTEGWLRIGMEQSGIPYDYISVHDVRDTPDLRARWDVLVFGPSTSNALSLVRGMQGPNPIMWKATEVTPNIGRQASTDDMRGGLELSGVLNLERFVRAGGTLVAIESSASLPVHFGLAQGVTIRDPEDLWAPGGVFRTEVADAGSPLAYGYGSELGVYFDSGPVLGVGGGGGGFGGGGFGGGFGNQRGEPEPGSTTERRSGRGGIGEPDIVQTRPRDAGQAGVAEFRRSNPNQGGGQGGFGGGASSSARTVLRFSGDVTKLLISGGLTGGSALAGAPALVDAPLGDGHVIVFAFNPFWRGETAGSYALLFNALLHHGHLSAGTAVADR